MQPDPRPEHAYVGLYCEHCPEDIVFFRSLAGDWIKHGLSDPAVKFFPDAMESAGKWALYDEWMARIHAAPVEA